MSSLAERLQRIKDGFLAQVPDAAKQIMQRTHDELASSGWEQRLVQVGARLPRFELSDTQGERWDSDAVLARGPLLLTVYRGVW